MCDGFRLHFSLKAAGTLKTHGQKYMILLFMDMDIISGLS